jgi:hypothetical protein
MKDIPVDFLTSELGAVSEKVRADSYLVMNMNIFSNDAEQNWYHAILELIQFLRVIHRVLTFLSALILWTDGAPNYHNSAFVLSLAEMFRLTGIRIQRRTVLESGHGKSRNDMHTGVLRRSQVNGFAVRVYVFSLIWFAAECIFTFGRRRLTHSRKLL